MNFTRSNPAIASNATIITQAEARATAAESRGDIPSLIQALDDEADARLRNHEFEAGEKLRLRVLHLEEQHAGRDSLPVSDALLNLGWFYGNMARYEEAQTALDRCLDIRQRVLGQDAVPVAEALNALGALEENRSNLSLADAFYEQAIAIQEKTLGVQSPVTANTWNNLATLDWILGDYAAAQKLFLQALAVREKTLGPNSVVVAKTLNNLALLDCSLGDYDEAEDYFQRALRIRTASLGPDNPATMTTLSQLGLLYVQKGDDVRAEPLLVQAMAAQQKYSQADDPDVARSLEQLAMLYDRRHQYDKAGPLHRRAVEIRRKVLGDAHPEYAASLAALARHDHAQGYLAQARPLYEQALKVDQDALGRNHPDTLAIASGLALLKIELRQPDDAGRLAHDLAEAQQNVLNGVFTFTAERQRMEFERTIEPCDLPAALADADLLAETVLRTKGVVLDSLLEDEALNRAARDPELSQMMETRRLLLAQLAQGETGGDSAGPDFSTSPTTRADRQKLEQQVRDLETSLANKGIASGETRRSLSTELADVRDHLPPHAALVEFIAYNRYTGRLTSDPSYGAIVIAPDAECQWVPIGSATEIENRVQLYQKYMRKRVRETALAQVLHGLYETLCQPVVAALPPGTSQLIICPDGNLNFVSFATLLDGQDHFFANDFELRYVSSGRDLLRKPAMPPRAKRLVVFADPDYNHAPGSAVPSKGRSRSAIKDDDLLPPLLGTEREAAFLLQEAKREGLDAQIYRGLDASKENLAKQDSPYVLHLATHGLYLSESMVANVPTPDGTKSWAMQPMSRSLLALTGGALTLRDWKKGIFPPTENDGLLTAQQAAALNLDRTWLVVLSACDTGGGEARAGEGVLGLRRGFAEAGAQNLLMTLWTADDAQTASLMEAFYRETLHTADAPGSLARVQRQALDDMRAKSSLFEAVHKAGPFILSY